MQFELTIKGDSFEEIASIFNRSARHVVIEDEPEVEHQTGEAKPRAKEVEPETTKKPSRSKKANTAASAEATTAPSKEPASDASAASPSDEKVTFEDLRAFASSLMDSGKADGRAIQEMLQEKFGVKAFGPLAEEQYPAVKAALEDLAA